jgi:hypothetical protein
MKCRIENLIRAESPPAVAAQIVASSRNAIFYRVEYRRNPAGARHSNAREGSFALAYPLSRQSRAESTGIGTRPPQRRDQLVRHAPALRAGPTEILAAHLTPAPGTTSPPTNYRRSAPPQFPPLASTRNILQEKAARNEPCVSSLLSVHPPT